MAKAQFYLLAGFIFVFLIFSLSGGVWYLSTSQDSFSELKSNYVREANKVINEAVYSGLDPFVRLDDYTKKFIRYAKTKNVDFGVVFILSYDGHLKIVNYLNNNINIYYKDSLIKDCLNGLCSPLEPSNLAYVAWIDEVTVRFADKSYNFDLDELSDMELKVLFKGELRR
ncbi:hypothetical protein JXM83_01000 [Candidatus Woesearchaeota archaeon]|nr:hypothetical protein [Candidatus Woesearchaeota archaeon]